MGLTHGVISLYLPRIPVRIGVYPQEHAQPQELEIAIELVCDFSEAAQTDALVSTPDYSALATLAVQMGQTHVQLLEKWVCDYAGAVLRNFEKVAEVDVSITKPSPVGLPPGAKASARIRLSRPKP